MNDATAVVATLVIPHLFFEADTVPGVTQAHALDFRAYAGTRCGSFIELKRLVRSACDVAPNPIREVMSRKENHSIDGSPFIVVYKRHLFAVFKSKPLHEPAPILEES